jgi:nucleotide-binding universal stress UspA family protein
VRTIAARHARREDAPGMYRKLLVGYAPDRHGADALALGRVLASTGSVEEVLVVEARKGSDDASPAEGLANGWPPGVRVTPRVVSGDSPVHAISSTADSEGADLVVLGTSHRGFAGRLLAGTTAGALFPDAHWPVVIAPAGYAEEPPPLREIGVGYDGSSESRTAMRWAVALAGAFGAEVRLIAVVQPPPPAETWSPGVPTSTWEEGFAVEQSLEAAELMREGMRRELEAAQADAGEGRTESVVVVGDARQELRDAAADVDLLVVGSHREGRIAGALSHSVARGLAHSSPVPLAVVPAEIHEEVANAPHDD